MQYSRNQPSPAFQELTLQYQQLHASSRKIEERADIFPGKSLFPHIDSIKKIIDETKSYTILDYGAGKGKQYTDVWVKHYRRFSVKAIPEYWGVEVTPWDPGYPPLSKMPSGQFDGVISTDVLEHIPTEDLPWVLSEIFSYSRKFVFINIGNYPAGTVLPDGRNAHVSVMPTAQWKEIVEDTARSFPSIKFVVRVTHQKGKIWDDIANFDWTAPKPSVGILPAGYRKVASYYLKRLLS